jgi:hypothetical protein
MVAMSRRSFVKRAGLAFGVVVCLVWLAAVSIAGQGQTSGSTPAIPENATSLEGVPAVQLEATREGAKRRTLGSAEAASHGLKISIKDGRYYWASRDNRPLTLSSSGDFTYLTSTEPGQYIRFRKINDRISYVEHVDTDFRSVTYWGELRIGAGK